MLEFPKAVPAEAPETEPGASELFPEAEAETPASNRPGILVVDDEPAIREFLTRFLKILKVDVTTANNGVEGLQKLSAGSFNVILSYIKMPKMGGIEFFRQASEKFPGIHSRFVFMTGVTLRPRTSRNSPMRPAAASWKSRSPSRRSGRPLRPPRRLFPGRTEVIAEADLGLPPLAPAKTGTLRRNLWVMTRVDGTQGGILGIPCHANYLSPLLLLRSSSAGSSPATVYGERALIILSNFRLALVSDQ